MAKASKPAEASTQSPATDAPAKPKRVNLFTNEAAAEQRKREAKVRFQFNVAANKIKKMELSADSERQIVEILKKEYQTKAAEALKPQEPAAETESAFV